jgi:hypothetical protein
VTDGELLRAAADRLEDVAARSTPGDWRTGGLLATRPEVIAHRDSADGERSTEHVAEARAGSGAWIAALSPAVAPPIATLLRAVADGGPVDRAAAELASVLLGRLGEPPS